MSNVFRIPTAKTPSLKTSAPFKPSMKGISIYPSYASHDFEAAVTRFVNAVEQTAAGNEHIYLQSLKDRAVYLELLPESLEDAVDRDDLDAFVLAVTGHPRAWLASWHYMCEIHAAMNASLTDEERQELIEMAYTDAISVIGFH